MSKDYGDTLLSLQHNLHTKKKSLPVTKVTDRKSQVPDRTIPRDVISFSFGCPLTNKHAMAVLVLVLVLTEARQINKAINR